MGARCDVCGNFDEEFRKEMEYPKDSDTAYKIINLIAIIIGTHH